MDSLPDLLKELEELKSVKYRMGEWEDMEENDGLITLLKLRIEDLQAQQNKETKQSGRPHQAPSPLPEREALTIEQVLAELNPSEREAALLDFQEGKTPQEIKEFFDSL